MRALVLEELLEKVKNRFLLTVASARRARQLREGAKPMIDAPADESSVIIALDEILEDKIKIEVGEITGQKFSDGDELIKKMTLKAAEVKEQTEKEAKVAKEAKDKADKKPVKKVSKEAGSKKKKKSRSMAA